MLETDLTYNFQIGFEPIVYDWYCFTLNYAISKKYLISYERPIIDLSDAKRSSHENDISIL